MITRETVAARPTTVSFYFDPICPWTWITSRWLVEIAETRGVTVEWRAMSLAELNGGVERMPVQYQEMGRFSNRALRMIEALRAAGLHVHNGRFYTEMGTRLHVEGELPGMELLRDAAEAADVSEYLGAAQDRFWDIAVSESTHAAIELAGPDTGSPVLLLDGQPRGFHGPIVSPAPHGRDALELWDAFVTLSRLPGFYEMKHGRSGTPQIEPVEPGVSESAR